MIKNNRFRQQPKREAGFTLIEIMVVIVILGILGALVVPNFISRPDEVRVQAAKNDILAITTALEMYRLDNGLYPSSDQGLEALVNRPSGFPEARRWSPDGYMKKMPVDPWDEPYGYFSEGRKFEIYTYGADRKEGGEGFDADLSSNES